MFSMLLNTWWLVVFAQCLHLFTFRHIYALCRIFLRGDETVNKRVQIPGCKLYSQLKSRGNLGIKSPMDKRHSSDPKHFMA